MSLLYSVDVLRAARKWRMYFSLPLILLFCNVTINDSLERSLSAMVVDHTTLVAEVEGSGSVVVPTFEELALCKEIARPEWVAGEANSVSLRVILSL